jgi:hypothetical protein
MLGRVRPYHNQPFIEEMRVEALTDAFGHRRGWGDLPGQRFAEYSS